MQSINFKRSDFLVSFLGAAIGALIGGIMGYNLQNPFITSKWGQFAASGAAIGFLVVFIYRWLIYGREVILESVEIPLFGAKIKVNFTQAHRLIGWKIFVETATRISAQSLNRKDGSIREAMTSLYKLFEIVRTELKTQLPSAPPEESDAYTIESYAILMLNDALRPMLSRWHPRLASWEKMGRSESDWGLADLCREDLEKTRQRVLVYVRGLGEILKIHDVENLLPPMVEEQAELKLVLEEKLDAKEAELKSYLDDAHRAAGWRIFVELASRIATQPLEEKNGNIREALTSLYKLYDIIRTEIKQLNPSKEKSDRQIKENDNIQNEAEESNQLKQLQEKSNNPKQIEAGKTDTVESIALSILNRDLRTFLSKWHPILLKYEEEKKPESEWEQATECRTDLANLQTSLSGEAAKLGELIKIRVEDYLPSKIERKLLV